MRLIRPRFRLRALLFLVALAAIASWRLVLWWRPPPELMVQGVRLSRPSPGAPRTHKSSGVDLGIDLRGALAVHLIGRRLGRNPGISRKPIAARDPRSTFNPLLQLHSQTPLSYSQDDLWAFGAT